MSANRQAVHQIGTVQHRCVGMQYDFNIGIFFMMEDNPQGKKRCVLVTDGVEYAFLRLTQFEREPFVECRAPGTFRKHGSIDPLEH